MTDFPSHPFGDVITAETVQQAMSEAKGWEDKYRYVIQIGKQLQPINSEDKIDTHLVSGCESKVWLIHRWEDGKIQLWADSDARIVKGLLAVVLAAYNGKTAEEINTFDKDAYFTSLGLLNHLTPTRSNGIHAVIDKIIENSNFTS
ncbi:cysteine desulfurase sulfur acceptor subunit CsdE [Parasalinivibrio latis]|uniref:cysteine desulfurase sulfur acceptor subunit CsdE n=1 Tax=Parasalinivibrio latis TaxID=2952610 RepID=UPI0030E49535